MTALKKVKPHPDVVDYFKELQFYNKHIEKPKIKRLKKHWLAFWTSFLWRTERNKTNQVFRGCAMSHKVEIVEKKDPIKQLEVS